MNNVAPILWYDWMCDCTDKTQGICTVRAISQTSRVTNSETDGNDRPENE